MVDATEPAPSNGSSRVMKALSHGRRPVEVTTDRATAGPRVACQLVYGFLRVTGVRAMSSAG